MIKNGRIRTLTVKRNKGIRITFIVSLVFMILFALSVLLFKPGSYLELNKDNRSLMTFAGLLFWISLIITIATTIAVSSSRKKYFKANNISLSPKTPAVITFFSNKLAIVADIAFLVFLIVFIILAFTSDGFAVFVFLSLTILGFEAHCVLNGKNIRYIKMISSEVMRNECK